MLKREFTIRLDEGVELQDALRLLRRRFIAKWEPKVMKSGEGKLSVRQPYSVPTRKHERPRGPYWYWFFLRGMRIKADGDTLRVKVHLSNGLWMLMLAIAGLFCAGVLKYSVGDPVVTGMIAYLVFVAMLMPPAVIIYGIILNIVRDWMTTVLSEE
jgi:hypothetical protein